MPEVKKSTDEDAFDLFKELAQLPDQPPPRQKIAIVATPRCGSSFFCKSLASTGRFGRPREWLNKRYMAAYLRLFALSNLNLKGYLRFIIAKTTSENGVFTLKFHVEQHVQWQKQGFDILNIGFDRIYHVYRLDKLAQALSLAKALQTDQWTSNNKPMRDVPLDRIRHSDILRTLHQLCQQEEYLAAHLAPRVSRSYCYEDYLSSDTSFHEVLRECGVTADETLTFACDTRIQRGPEDARKLRELVAYLGCQDHA